MPLPALTLHTKELYLVVVV